MIRKSTKPETLTMAAKDLDSMMAVVVKMHEGQNWDISVKPSHNLSAQVGAASRGLQAFEIVRVPA